MNPIFYPNRILYPNIDTPPNAFALISGSRMYPDISGIVKFYNTPQKGFLLYAEVFNLPAGAFPNIPSFHGFHIHENGDCSNQFANTGNHYNPQQQPHPSHAGDLPPLMSFDGYAFLCVYVSHIKVEEIIGRSIIIHSQADDFTTQPSGNSGDKIACGVIKGW